MNLHDNIIIDVLILLEKYLLPSILITNYSLNILCKDRVVLERVFNSMNMGKGLDFNTVSSVIRDYSDVLPVSKVAIFMNSMRRTILDNLLVISQNIIINSNTLYLDKYIVSQDNPIFIKMVEKVKSVMALNPNNELLIEVKMLDYIMDIIINYKQI